MFDEMTLKGRITPEQELIIIDKLGLQECTRGETVYWQSSVAGRFDATHAIVIDGKFTLRFSCHKLWSKWSGCGLDNSRPFRMSDAIATISALLSSLHLDAHEVRCTRFEIGLSMQMPAPPVDYISSMRAIGQESGKDFYIDANYQPDLQRTTVKARTFKKIFKVYDKTAEMEDKDHDVDANILRIETIYRRQQQRLDELLDTSNMCRLLARFNTDWSAAKFARDVVGDKGTKASQLEKARGIMIQGLEEYRAAQRREFLQRRITKKTWETVRTFCDAWNERYCHMFRSVPGQLEQDYQRIMRENYEYSVK